MWLFHRVRPTSLPFLRNCVIGTPPTPTWHRSHQVDKRANLRASQPPFYKFHYIIRFIDAWRPATINTHFRTSQTCLYRVKSDTCPPSRDIRPAFPESTSGYLHPSKDTISGSPTKTTMSSDEAYTSFLDKANEDPNASVPEGARTMATDRFMGTRTIDPKQEVPTVLNNVEEYYVSDTDEAFEPVALNWDGAKSGRWPSSST